MSTAVLFNTLLETVTDTVLILDVNNRVLYCGGPNTWAQTERLKGRSMAQLFRAETARLLNNLCGQLRRGEELKLSEFYLTPAHAPELIPLGLNRSYLFHVTARLADDCVVLILQDISQQRAVAALANKHRTYDPLTRTYNRKTMLPILNQAIAQSQRYEYNCSLALVDVDDLGEINLRAGWAVGDQVLQLLAARLDTFKRTSDFLVRIGEDRFALMLPETSIEQSTLVGNRIVSRVQEIDVPWEQNVLKFSVSVGIATLRGLTDNTEQMFRRATANLMLAKEFGGNRVIGDEQALTAPAVKPGSPLI